jgi:hypothetical protein
MMTMENRPAACGGAGIRCKPRPVRSCAFSRATISFHHEKLADAAQREAMRTHWHGVLD